MSVFTGYEPQKVLEYFEKISAIPHGSGNTKPISDYLADFAKERNLKYIQDSSNNIIIWKEGSKGYENSQPVILQGHMDMVCEKSDDCDIDFEKDGLTLQVIDGVLSADGTTLGGDDGIAVAFALAILDDDSIAHPPIEVVITVDEEIGMLGAAAMDMSVLKGRIMVNLDSEDENTLLVSCAGGATPRCIFPITRESKEGISIKVEVEGLLGGHSGEEINKGRASSNQLMGRVLNYISKNIDYSLIRVDGGLKDNAIPRKTVAELIADEKNVDDIVKAASEIEKDIKAEYAETDKNIKVVVSVGDKLKTNVMTAADKTKIVTSLFAMPWGVQRMSRDIEGLVQTSLNMGILATGDEEVIMEFSVRSSVKSEKEELLDKLEAIVKSYGGTMEVEGVYPAWEYKKESKLRDLMVDIYKEMYGREPGVEAIHAGLECGIFSDNLKGLDCVSIGPNIKDIHTYAESVEIASIERSWKYLLEILKKLK